MAEVQCRKCGERFKLANTCPMCGEEVPLRQRQVALQDEIDQAEAEMERLSKKDSPFTKAKIGALRSKISVLKMQIDNIRGDRD
jgi:hypothetical protein